MKFEFLTPIAYSPWATQFKGHRWAYGGAWLPVHVRSNASPECHPPPPPSVRTSQNTLPRSFPHREPLRGRG